MVYKIDTRTSQWQDHGDGLVTEGENSAPGGRFGRGIGQVTRGSWGETRTPGPAWEGEMWHRTCTRCNDSIEPTYV